MVPRGEPEGLWARCRGCRGCRAPRKVLPHLWVPVQGASKTDGRPLRPPLLCWGRPPSRLPSCGPALRVTPGAWLPDHPVYILPRPSVCLLQSSYYLLSPPIHP